MNNLEQQLNKLPKGRLRLIANIKIRWRLYLLFWQRRIASLSLALVRVKLLPATTILIALALVLIIPTYAYASSNVTVGHFLYPVKQVIENIEIAVAISPVAKVNTYTKMAERRLAEASQLSQRQINQTTNQALTKTVNQAVVLEEQAVNQTASIVSGEKANQAQAVVTQANDVTLEKLSQITQEVGMESDEPTLDSLASAVDNLRQLKSRVKKMTTQPSKQEGKVKFIEPEKSLPVATTTLEPEIVPNLPVKENQPKLPTWLNSTERQKQRFEAGGLPMATSQPAMIKPLIVATTTNQQLKEQTATGSTKYFGSPNFQQAKPSGKARTFTNKEAARQSLVELENNISQLKQELNQSIYQPKDLDKLFKRLDKKLETTEQAVEIEKLDKAEKLFKSAEVFTRNAKFFIKPKVKLSPKQEELNVESEDSQTVGTTTDQNN